MQITIRRAARRHEDIAHLRRRALRGTFTSSPTLGRVSPPAHVGGRHPHPLAAVVDGEVVDQLTLHGITRPRRKARRFGHGRARR